LDYSGVGPEHAYLMKSGRVTYESATDSESLDALAECAKYEGILPAIETAHAFFGARRFAMRNPGAQILIGCSGGATRTCYLAEHASERAALMLAPSERIGAAIEAAVAKGVRHWWAI